MEYPNAPMLILLYKHGAQLSERAIRRGLLFAFLLRKMNLESTEQLKLHVCNLNVIQQSACLVIMTDEKTSLFNCVQR